MDSTKEHTEEQRVLSFCYGYGGLESGVNAVIPIRTVAYVEIEAFQVFNLVAAMEAGMVDKAPVWTNLKTFDARPFRKKVHGIIAGYPCQGESNAGKRQLWNDPRFLWPYIERAMLAAKPFWGFFENVSAHLSGSFPYVLESLQNMGYAIEPGLFTAEEVGAPHRRKRLFILAIKKELVNTYFNGYRAGGHTLFRTGEKIEGKTQGKDRQRSGDVIGNTGKEMGNSNIERLQRYRSKYELQKSHEKRAAIGTGKFMANPYSIRDRKSLEKPKSTEFNKNGQKWPAHPGEPQHQWEEPRTIGKINRLPNSLRSTWSKNRKNFTKILGEKIWKETNYRIQAHFESGLGCTVNGYNFRTELLRQYGNGVVPDQAEYAFK